MDAAHLDEPEKNEGGAQEELRGAPSRLTISPKTGDKSNEVEASDYRIDDLVAFAIAASGQTTTNIQQVVLQDDKSGDHLVFVIPTGEYKFQSCKGNFTISGKGSVSVTGCSVVLKDVTDTRRVLAEVDLCAKSGKADVAFVSDSLPVDAPAVDFTVSDSNTGDSAFDCTSPGVSPK